MILLFLPLIGRTQCTPNYSYTSPGIYPDTMPTGYVNQPYSEDISFVLPTDTQGYDFTNFEIVSIALPVGLSWQCDNFANGCNYNPQVNQYGCVNVFGTPLLAGQYQVDVSIIADLTIVQGVPTTFSVFMEILPDTTPVSNNGFGMVGSIGCAPLTVSFTNNNPGLLSYNWDFGNGNTSTLENPTPQIYTTPGDYVVSYEAFSNLDTIELYTLTGVDVTSMSGYGGGFPSYDNADTYYKIFENGTLFNQSSFIADTDPPVSWATSLILNPANTYTIEIWEADDSAGEVILGADDYIGSHTMNLSGCNGCAAGNSTINYAINYQQILPSANIVSVDTVHVGDYPIAPTLSFDSLNSTLSFSNLGDVYQWLLNGVVIPGATDTSLVIDSSGYYSVIAYNAYGCSAYSDSIVGIYCSPTFEPNIQLNASGDLEVTNSMNYDIQWIMGTNPIPGDTNLTCTPQAPENYFVLLTDPFGCEYLSDYIFVNVGLNENETASWKVYPNPAKDQLRIDVDGASVDRLELVDITGRVVKQIDEIDEVTQIDLSEINNGAYIVKIYQNQSVWSTQLLIQR